MCRPLSDMEVDAAQGHQQHSQHRGLAARTSSAWTSRLPHSTFRVCRVSGYSAVSVGACCALHVPTNTVTSLTIGTAKPKQDSWLRAQQLSQQQQLPSTIFHTIIKLVNHKALVQSSGPETAASERALRGNLPLIPPAPWGRLAPELSADPTGALIPQLSSWTTRKRPARPSMSLELAYDLASFSTASRENSAQR